MLRNGDLADVVQQRSRPQRFHFTFADLQFFADLQGIHLDALQMLVRGLILSFNRQSERFDGPEMHAGGLFRMDSGVLQSSDVYSV